MATSLSAAAIADGIIYVYGTWGTTGDGFNAGNNATANGDASNPYETPDAALAALNEYFADDLHSGQTGDQVVDKNYCIRIVVNTGETNTYSDAEVNFRSSTANIGNEGTILTFIKLYDTAGAKIIFQGWKRSDGDVRTIGPVSTWTDGAGVDKPQWTFGFVAKQNATNSGGHHCLHSQWKDLRLVVAGSVGDFFNQPSTSGTWASENLGPQFFGCHISGGVAKFDANNVTNRGRAALISCLYFGAVSGGTGTTNGLLAIVNSYMEGSKCFGESSATDIRAFNTICRAIGGFAIDQPATTVASGLSEHNCYFLDGGLFINSSSGVFATLADAITAGRASPDQASIEADPQIVADGTDYRLQDSSPCVGAGGQSTNVNFTNAISDPDAKGWDKYDFLNKEYSDTGTEIVGLYGNRTRRSIGPFQNLSAAAPDKPRVLFPVDATVGNISHVVGEAKISPQGGTIAGRVIVADDINLTTNVSIYDSTPITITAAVNDKIDFREDDTTTFAATLTPGVYSTATLATEIKTQLEAAGAGTYTVTYDGLAGGNTRKYTISVAGGATTVIIQWATGTNALTSVRPELGFRQLDTTDAASHTSDDPVEENFYDAALTWEYATDYSAGADPQVSGTWGAMGTGEPSASGTPGTDGALGDGTADIRVDLPTAIGLDGKFIAFANYSGSKLAAL